MQINDSGVSGTHRGALRLPKIELNGLRKEPK
jgi:hypothetical protein